LCDFSQFAAVAHPPNADYPSSTPLPSNWTPSVDYSATALGTIDDRRRSVPSIDQQPPTHRSSSPDHTIQQSPLTMTASIHQTTTIILSNKLNHNNNDTNECRSTRDDDDRLSIDDNSRIRRRRQTLVVSSSDEREQVETLLQEISALKGTYL
jgi:hypothetical protein